MEKKTQEIADYQKDCINIGRRHGIPASRLASLLAKTDPTPKYDDPSEIWTSTDTVQVNEFKWCLCFLLAHCTPTITIDALESDNLRDVCNRIMFMNYVMDPMALHYTADELATLIAECSTHLRFNQEHLITTGYPQVRFGSSLWLDWSLTDLYRTKFPASVTRRERKDGHSEYTYKWTNMQLSHPLPHPLFLGSPYAFHSPLNGTSNNGWGNEVKESRSVPYEMAPQMEGLSLNEAYIMEKGRPPILAAKLFLLNSALTALNRKDADMLRQEGVSILQGLFSKPEISFFFNMDYPAFIKCYGNSAGPVCGGLTCLMNVMGVVEYEIRHGLTSSTIKALGELFVRRKNGQACFNASSGWFTKAELRKMDNAMVICAQFQGDYKDFQTQYSKEITDSLTQPLSEEVSVSVRVPSSQAVDVRKLFQELATHVDTVLSKEPRKDDLTRKKPSFDNESRDQQFRFCGDFWDVRYLGKIAQIKDSVGIRYLAILLKHPRSQISPSELVQMINKEDPDTIRKSQLGDSHELEFSGDPSQDVIDRKTIQDIRKKIHLLQEDIDHATEAQDFGRADTASVELESLISYLKANMHNGKSRAMASVPERDRKSVGNAIRRAIKGLEIAVPDLASHFANSLDYSSKGFMYSPSTSTVWRVDTPD